MWSFDGIRAILPSIEIGEEDEMSEIEAKSYRYLRITIVILLLGIGVAVLYQTWRQNFHLLDSVSAYYYTPAQSIFVGALIGAGACMVALKGTTEFEDVVLNLAGFFAAVVAIVPSTRGADFETAVRACQQMGGGPLLTQQASGDLSCPTVQALADATRANVENNMVTLLVLGLLGLLVTISFALVDRRSQGGRIGAKVVWGFGLTFVLWALGWVALLLDKDWFIHHAHYIAGAGLFICLLAVTLANALRRQRREPGGLLSTIGAAVGTLFRWPLDPYAWVAWAMVGGIAVTGSLYLLDLATLFWLEIVMALVFVAFWLVQTVELLAAQAQAQPAPEVSAASAA
ncbi:MAG TPA: hypothetical protein VH561_15840 [Micromonosporaceae bacterium]